MSNELTLFGKAMQQHKTSSARRVWWAKSGSVLVNIYEESNGWFSWSLDWREADCLGAPFATKELARDAAEAALRELYDSLGDVVEPWVFDRDPEPPDNPMYHDSYLCMWDDTWVSESDWDGERWRRYGNVVLDRPYAWRPMPKGPGRKAT